MKRLPFIAGNWKMNGDEDATKQLCKALVARAKDWPKVHGRAVDVAVFPPFVSLPAAAKALKGSHITLGAQNMHDAESGAYTGEVSGAMLLTAGCRMVILGHSERRQLFGESDAWINRKLLAALNVELRPILCVGETLDEREANKTEEVVERQLTEGLKGLTEGQLLETTLAYEPVWAIGTGKTATVEQAGSVHRFIREWIARKFSRGTADVMRIQYGGSVKPDNAAALLADPDIDGALVGGASLDAEKFDAIIRASA
jgi:triosephosphate isomerase